jgi:hypothetical protein
LERTLGRLLFRNSISPNGGIGIHKGLLEGLTEVGSAKIPRSQGHAGSSPASGIYKRRVMVLIKIDRNSIKKNEDAGRTEFLVPGRATYNEDGSMSRPVSVVRSLMPVPNYSASYKTTEVECKFCHAKFSHDELDDDTIGNGEDEYSLDNICPKCREADCCEEIEFEKFNNSTGKCG